MCHSVDVERNLSISLLGRVEIQLPESVSRDNSMLIQVVQNQMGMDIVSYQQTRLADHEETGIRREQDEGRVGNASSLMRELLWTNLKDQLGRCQPRFCDVNSKGSGWERDTVARVSRKGQRETHEASRLHEPQAIGEGRRLGKVGHHRTCLVLADLGHLDVTFLGRGDSLSIVGSVDKGSSLLAEDISIVGRWDD